MEASGVTAYFSNGIITLVFDEAITSSQEYEISVVEDGKTDSGKLPITVYPNPEAYAPGITWILRKRLLHFAYCILQEH